VTRIMPVPYSPPTASTARIATTAWPRSMPDRLTLAGSWPQADPLFEPFRRLGNSRTRRREGHGLGLAIVRAIATAHDAELAATARPGGGLDITVTFPRP
jgi:hypothetical protein